MKNIYWTNNKLNKLISEMEYIYQDNPSEENYQAIDLLNRLKDQKNITNPANEPFITRFNKDKSIAEMQQSFMPDFKKFVELSKLSNYKVGDIGEIVIEKKVILSFLHDFYHSVDKEIAKLFDRVYKERKNNLQILNEQDYPNNQTCMYYINPLKYPLFNITLSNTIADYLNIVHEYAHAIADLMKYRSKFGNYPFIELLPTFMEELSYDYLITYFEHVYNDAVTLNLKELLLMYQYCKDISIQNNFLSICTNINIRKKFVQQMAKYGNNTITKTERILTMPFEEKITYVIPYLTMIELYQKYQDDPELSIYLTKQIIRAEDQEDYRTYLDDLNISLNDHTEEFVNSKKKNNITQYL